MNILCQPSDLMSYMQSAVSTFRDRMPQISDKELKDIQLAIDHNNRILMGQPTKLKPVKPQRLQLTIRDEGLQGERIANSLPLPPSLNSLQADVNTQEGVPTSFILQRELLAKPFDEMSLNELFSLVVRCADCGFTLSQALAARTHDRAHYA